MASKKNPSGWRFEAGQRVTAYPHTKQWVHGTIRYIQGSKVTVDVRDESRTVLVTDKDLVRGWRSP